MAVGDSVARTAFGVTRFAGLFDDEYSADVAAVTALAAELPAGFLNIVCCGAATREAAAAASLLASLRAVVPLSATCFRCGADFAAAALVTRVSRAAAALTSGCVLCFRFACAAAALRRAVNVLRSASGMSSDSADELCALNSP